MCYIWKSDSVQYMNELIKKMNCENRLLMWMKQMKMRNNNNKKESCEREKSHENDSCEDKWIMCKHYMWREKKSRENKWNGEEQISWKMNHVGKNSREIKWIMCKNYSWKEWREHKWIKKWIICKESYVKKLIMSIWIKREKKRENKWIV